MKATDLREKSVDDLVELQKALAHDIFENRLKNFTNRLDDTSAIRKTKRDLARVVTLLRARELSASPKSQVTQSARGDKAAASVKAVVNQAQAATKKKSAKKSEAKS